MTPLAMEPRPTFRKLLAQGLGVALVAVLCAVTARLLPVQETYWAPISAVVVLFPDPSATRKAGINRLFGTAIGSLVGWACAAWWHDAIALYGVGVLVAVVACNLARVGDASRIAAVAVSVITLVPHTGPAHVVALHRFVAVSYGVICALGTMSLEDAVLRWRRRRAP